MTDAPETETAAKPRRRWMGPLLIASLALNLLVLGAVAGFGWRHGGPHGPWGGRHGGPDRILWLLPDEKRDGARAIIERYRANESARDSETKAGRDAVAAALTAEPFSQPALESALRRVGEAEIGRRLNPKMLAEIAATLSLDERKELAEHLGRMMERRGRWGGKGP